MMDTNIRYKRDTDRQVRSFLEPLIGKFLVNYDLVTSGLIVKQPGEGDLPIHRDWTFAKDLSDYIVNCWCPLIDVDSTNGAALFSERESKTS